MTALKVGDYHRGIVSPVTTVTVRVPAKVNLQLAVGPVRADGYHDVATVYHAVSLFDEVSVAPSPPPLRIACLRVW
jgi:4-diphosphocytidyl-2-C-methyl-D-erythritol kinase